MIYLRFDPAVDHEEEAVDEASVRRAMIDGAFYFSSIRLRDAEDASVERTPIIEAIDHNAEAGAIAVRATVEGERLGDDAYVWISEGRTVHTGPRLDYRCAEGVGAYVRLEITGSGGTTYTNPFGLRAAASR